MEVIYVRCVLAKTMIELPGRVAVTPIDRNGTPQKDGDFVVYPIKDAIVTAQDIRKAMEAQREQ